MQLLSTILTCWLLGNAVATPSDYYKSTPKVASFKTFSSKTIYVPDANYTDPRVLYARTVELNKGVLLATWENYSPGKSCILHILIVRADNQYRATTCVLPHLQECRWWINLERDLKNQGPGQQMGSSVPARSICPPSQGWQIPQGNNYRIWKLHPYRSQQDQDRCIR